MNHLNLNAVNSRQPLGHALGEVHGTSSDPGEEIGNGLVAARVPAQRFILVRIRHCPAIEDESSPVAGLVLRQPPLKREGCDGICNPDCTGDASSLLFDLFVFYPDMSSCAAHFESIDSAKKFRKLGVSVIAAVEVRFLLDEERTKR